MLTRRRFLALALAAPVAQAIRPVGFNATKPQALEIVYPERPAWVYSGWIVSGEVPFEPTMTVVAECSHCGRYGPLGTCEGCGAPNRPLEYYEEHP